MMEREKHQGASVLREDRHLVSHSTYVGHEVGKGEHDALG